MKRIISPLAASIAEQGEGRARAKSTKLLGIAFGLQIGTSTESNPESISIATAIAIPIPMPKSRSHFTDGVKGACLTALNFRIPSSIRRTGSIWAGAYSR